MCSEYEQKAIPQIHFTLRTKRRKRERERLKKMFQFYYSPDTSPDFGTCRFKGKEQQKQVKSRLTNHDVPLLVAPFVV